MSTCALPYCRRLVLSGPQPPVRIRTIAGRAIEAGAAAGALCGSLVGLPFVYFVLPPVIGALVGVLVGEVLALLSVPVLVAVAKARFSPAGVWVLSAATVCGVLAAFAQFLLGGRPGFTDGAPYSSPLFLVGVGLAAVVGGCAGNYAVFGSGKG